MSAPPRLLVDAAECPVKAEIYRLAARYGLQVVLVTAGPIGAPFEPWLTKVVVGPSPNAVVETIRNEVGGADLVITDNADLAAAVLQTGGNALTFRGQRWTASGPFPRLPETVRSNNRTRFESVLEDELRTRLGRKARA